MAFVNNWRTFDSHLIEFVRLNPILYNIRLKDFRNKHERKRLEKNSRRDELHRWIFYFDTTVGLFIHYMFAISRHPAVCLSSVCNVRAPYSGYWNFRQSMFTPLVFPPSTQQQKQQHCLLDVHSQQKVVSIQFRCFCTKRQQKRNSGNGRTAMAKRQRQNGFGTPET